MGPNECMILIAKRELVEQVYDYDMVIRHENAHCQGWRHGIAVADKPAWPRVIDKVADNQSAEKPKVENRKPKAAENAPTARPTARTAERPARQPMSAGRESINWPLAVVSTVIWTPLYALAAFADRGAR
jgi:hypothetical protein